MCFALKNATRIIYCCTQFHNCCSNEGGDIVLKIQHDDPSKLSVTGGTSMIGQSRMRQISLDKVAKVDEVDLYRSASKIHTNLHVFR